MMTSMMNQKMITIKTYGMKGNTLGCTLQAYIDYIAMMFTVNELLTTNIKNQSNDKLCCLKSIIVTL